MAVLSYILSVLYYVVLILTILLCISYIYFKCAFQFWRRKNVNYLEPTFPFGNIKHFFDDVHLSKRLANLYNEIQGPYAGVYFFNNPVLFVKDPELLKHILVKDFDKFRDKGFHVDETQDPLSGHLFRLSGHRWRTLRNKLSPTFTSGKLKMMFPILIKCAEQLRDTLESVAESGQVVDMWDISSCYTTDVISSAAFGIETNSFKDSSSDIVTFIKRFTDSNLSKFNEIVTLFTTCVPQAMKLFKLHVFNVEVSNFFLNLISKVINYRETNKVVRNDFMQLMIQLRNTGRVSDDDTAGDASIYDQKNDVQGLTLEEIAAHSFVFILAGYETSAVTMSFCLYELAVNPEIQKRVQRNIDETLENHGGKINYVSVKAMEYLTMVISETLRKHPPVGLLNRIANDNYQIPNSDTVINKGTQLIISVTGLHNDPNIYAEPSRFDPERFSAQNQDKINPFAYLPFGRGPRHCIGARLAKMQTSVGLAMILSKYTVSTCSETPETFRFVNGQLILSLTNGMKLAISKRK